MTQSFTTINKILLAAAILLPATLALPPAQDPPIVHDDTAPEPMPGRFVIWYDGNQKSAEAKKAIVGGIRKQAEDAGAHMRYEFHRIHAVTVDGLSDDVVDRIRHSPHVVDVVQDVVVTPDDGHSIPLVNAVPFGSPEGSQLPPGVDGTGAKICVIDTGIRASHEFFSGRVLISNTVQQDLVDDDFDPSEENSWHGTHVAGTCAGDHALIWSNCGNSYLNTRGVAPGATIIPFRVLGPNGGSSSDIAAAIERCVDMGGDVINLSLGVSGMRQIGQCSYNWPDVAEINAAWEENGVVSVTSSGNDSFNGGMGSPGCAEHAISVGAVYDGGCDIGDNDCTGEPTSADERTCFSNAANNLRLTAPGQYITSAYATSDSSYALASGTSMSAPHVSGLVALLSAEHPLSSPSPARAVQIMDVIYRSSAKFANRATHGVGRIDAAEAVAYLDYCVNSDGSDLCPTGQSCVRGPDGQMGCFDNCVVPENLFVRGTGGNIICGDSKFAQTGANILWEGQDCWLDCGPGRRPAADSVVPTCLNGEFVFNNPTCELDVVYECGRGDPEFEPTRVGDGVCDHNVSPLYNTLECGYDGGDCCIETCRGNACSIYQSDFRDCVDPGDCASEQVMPESGPLTYGFIEYSRDKWDNCLVCGGDGSTCEVCEEGMHFVDGQCVAPCPEGYVWDTDQCVPDCEDGFEPSGDDCVPIPQCDIPLPLPMVENGGFLTCGDGVTMYRGACELICNRNHIISETNVFPQCNEFGQFEAGSPSCRPVDLQTDCDVNVELDWLGDGWCDEALNNELCGWDLGDCCAETCCEGRVCNGGDAFLCPAPDHPMVCNDPGDCTGDLFGDSQWDACGVCGGDDSTCDGSCQVGEYRDGDNCLSCPEDTTSPSRSDSIDDCVCVAGYEPTVHKNVAQCSPCQAGTAKPDAGNDGCSVCENGFADEDGATECTPCSVCGRGASPSSECDSTTDRQCHCRPGYESMDENNDCTPVPFTELPSGPGVCLKGSGYGESGVDYTLVGTTTYDECLDICLETPSCVVIEHRTQGSHAGRCEMWHTMPDDTQSNTYGGVCLAKPETCNADEGNPCECPAGQENTQGTTCTPCEDGFFKTQAGTGTCQPCATCGNGATASTECGATNDRVCVCAAGYGGAAPSCTECAAGTAKATDNDGECSPCDEGSYAVGTGNQECTACSTCGDGAEVASACSTTSNTACTCSAGYDSLSNDNTCQQCAEGTFKASAGAATCASCPAESYAIGTGNTACEDCTTCEGNLGEDQACTASQDRTCVCVQNCEVDCPAGEYDTGFGSCEACPAGTYKESSGAGECVPCSGTGVVSSGQTGQSSVDAACQCDAGYEGQAPTCFECQAGAYKGDAGNGACTECGEDTFTTSTGSTSCGPCQQCGDGMVEHLSCGPNRNTICGCMDGYGDITNTNPPTCRQCPAGTRSYLDECQDCPAGSYSTEPGQTSCDECSGDGVEGTGAVGSDSMLDACQCADGYTGMPPQCTAGSAEWHHLTDDGQSGACLLDEETNDNEYGIRNTHYLLYTERTLDECKSLCMANDDCVAIEHRTTGSHAFRCEVWILMPDLESTDGGAQCLLRPTTTQCSADGERCECDAGYENVAGTACTPCETGYVKTEAGTHTCQACTECETDFVEDQQCSATQDRTCVCAANCATTCPAGQYLSSGECQDCPAGTYTTETNSYDECIPCGEHMTGNGATGQTSVADACECDVEGGYVGDAPACVAMPEWQNVREDGLEGACVSDSTENSYGEPNTDYILYPDRSIEQCKALCWNNEACKAIEHRTVGSHAFRCEVWIRTPIGETESNGIQCLFRPEAPAGCNADEGNPCECPAGQENTQGTTCTPCEDGFFKTEAGTGTCQPCTTCGQDFGEAEACTATTDRTCVCVENCDVTCPAGQYNDQGICRECASGSYQPSDGQDSCVQCEGAGVTGTGSTGATSYNDACVCEEGFEGEAPSCTPCQRGAYKSDNGNGACTTCAQGTYADDTGSTVCDECQACGEGTVEAIGCMSVTNAICSCQDGYGDLETSPSGEQVCTECPAGSYSTNGECRECPAGHYSTEPGQTECTPCPTDDHVVSSGETGQDTMTGACECAPGYTGTPPSCTEAPVGDWEPIRTDGAGACLMDTGNRYGDPDTHYLLYTERSLDECKDICLANENCKAIEHRTTGSHAFRCEVWIQMPDTGSTAGGAQCLRRPTTAVECSADGERCECDAGLENVAGTDCTPCETGYFKTEAGTHTCQACTECESNFAEDQQCSATQDRTCVCQTDCPTPVTWTENVGACLTDTGGWGQPNTDYVLFDGQPSLAECEQACVDYSGCVAIEWRNDEGAHPFRCELWVQPPQEIGGGSHVRCHVLNP